MVQCVKAGAQITVAAAHMPSRESTAVFVDRALDICRRTGVNIGNALLDRGFFGDVIITLERAGIGYLMPCPNALGVVAAIMEFTAGKRPATSNYTMIIVARRKRCRGSKSPPNPRTPTSPLPQTARPSTSTGTPDDG